MSRLGRAFPAQPLHRLRAVPSPTDVLSGSLADPSAGITLGLSHTVRLGGGTVSSSPGITAAATHTVPLAGSLSDSGGITGGLGGAANLAAVLHDSPALTAGVTHTDPLAGTVPSGDAMTATAAAGHQLGGTGTDAPAIGARLIVIPANAALMGYGHPAVAAEMHLSSLQGRPMTAQQVGRHSTFSEQES